MFDRIIATIALSLFKYLEGRMERGSVAVDADRDRGLLIRSGRRISDWLREQDRVRERGGTNAGRTKLPPEGVPPDQRGVDTLPRQDPGA